MDNVDTERKPEGTRLRGDIMTGMARVRCVTCGQKHLMRPPSTDDEGPIYLAYRNFCKTFKCSKCNRSL
jgi:hypothetical protein